MRFSSCIPVLADGHLGWLHLFSVVNSKHTRMSYRDQATMVLASPYLDSDQNILGSVVYKKNKQTKKQQKNKTKHKTKPWLQLLQLPSLNLLWNLSFPWLDLEVET